MKDSSGRIHSEGWAETGELQLTPKAWIVGILGRVECFGEARFERSELTKNDSGAESYQLISEERILRELCNQFFELLTSHIFLFLA